MFKIVCQQFTYICDNFDIRVKKYIYIYTYVLYSILQVNDAYTEIFFLVIKK